MTEDEIRATLAKALPMRPPRFGPNGGTPIGASAKISAMEDYLMESAYVAAELEEALHWADALVAHFAERIKKMTGYEVALPRKPRDRITQADIDHAKRLTEPTSFELGAEFKQLRTSILRQIERLRFEEQWVLSRGYTLITGG